jgi:conjugative transposon TraN protein
MVKFCWTVWNSKANYHDVRTKKDKMLFKLNNIYTIDDYFFMDIELVNQTKIKYDIDQVRFKIEDKKQTKSTNYQEIEIFPIMQVEKDNVFRKKYRNIFVFEKFTFPDQKVFTIEFSEKQISGRTVKLMIDYEDVLNADTFVE